MILPRSVAVRVKGHDPRSRYQLNLYWAELNPLPPPHYFGRFLKVYVTSLKAELKTSVGEKLVGQTSPSDTMSASLIYSPE